MNKVVLDAALREKLNGLNDEVELCDENGKTLGFIMSPEYYRQLRYAEAKTLVTDEELCAADEDFRQNGGMPTAAALEYINNIIGGAKGNA